MKSIRLMWGVGGALGITFLGYGTFIAESQGEGALPLATALNPECCGGRRGRGGHSTSGLVRSFVRATKGAKTAVLRGARAMTSSR